MLAGPLALFEAIALTVHLQDVDMVGQPVYFYSALKRPFTPLRGLFLLRRSQNVFVAVGGRLVC